MIEEDLHEPKTRPVEDPHPLLERMKHRGELVQIDGSPHDWLEDRAESYFAYVGLFKDIFSQARSS